MLYPDFKAAQLPSPSGRSADPGWLDGLCRGRPAFLLGAAGGLENSAGLRAAQGELVIGSNWTLRALVPSVWHVVDANVWKSERERLAGCPDSMVIVASKHIFGGGPYSVVGSNQLRVVGKKRWPVSEITISRASGMARGRDGVMRPLPQDPFLPKSMRDAYHLGGNSICYMVQTAHLLGCDPIYLLGFTLVSGTGYFFGLENPVTRRRSHYSDPGRALDWLRWYDSQHPGRVKLWPGWVGPVYDVLETLDGQEAQRLAERAPELRRRADSGSRHDEALQRLRPDRRDQPVHADGKQPSQAGAVREARQGQGRGGQRLRGVQRKPQPKGRVIGG